MGTLIIFLSSSILCLSFLSFFIKFLNKIWWTPIHIQSMLRSQGIKGPSYRFYHGNSKEIINMEYNASSNPMKFSNDQLFSTVLPHIYSWSKLYGKNFLYWHGPRAHIVVQEPSMLKDIFNRDEIFTKGEPEDYVKKLLGDGIVTARGEKWLKLRKISNHTFHAESLKGMIPGMIASVEMMLERWNNHDGKEIEAYKEFKILTSEIISRTAFGSSYLEGQHIFDMLIRLAVIVIRNKYKVRIPGIRNLVKTRDDTDSDKLEQGIHNSFMYMIKKREVAMTDQSGSFRNDFLGSLLKAYHENNMAKKITVANLIDECKTFYVAGHETTTSLLTWILLLLAIHPEWQEKAREEVLEIFGSQRLSSDGLTGLKIVSMIINETLRLYPPVVNVIRKVDGEVKLGELIIPENTEIDIPVIAIHHNPQIWGEDVYKFKPERFAEGVAKATNNNITAYLPFGLGPRNCVGSSFAITETKIALSMILQRYRFSLSPTYVHSPIPILTMCPQYGLQMVLHKL